MSKALKSVIQQLVLEQVIEEKFGHKIGEQPALPGVADERDQMNEDQFEEVATGEDIDLGEAKLRKLS